MITDLTETTKWIHACNEVDDGVHVHSSVYLLEEGDKYFLVDTGDTYHQEELLDDVDRVIGDQPIDTLFLSQSHLPHSANVTELEARYPGLDMLCPGGVPDLHGVRHDQIWPAQGTAELHGRQFSTTPGPLMDVSHTTWLYDHNSGVFFTIDGFCTYHPPGACNALAGDLDSGFETQFIELFYRDMFRWIQFADHDALVSGVREIVDEFDFEYIAPSHGHPISQAEIEDYVTSFDDASRAIIDDYLARTTGATTA